MQQEKQNNQWAETVGSLQELPEGFHFDAQHVWKGLEQQLPAPAKKDRFLYYAAASMLVIAAAIYVISPGKQPEQPLSVAIPAAPVHSSQEQPVKKDQSLGAAKKTTTIQTVIVPPAKKIEPALAKREEIVLTTAETKETAPEMQMPITSGPLVLEKKEIQKKKLVATTTKLAPKLKVIHLSELGLIPQPDPLTKQEFKQMVQQQQAEQQEAAPVREPLKQILYFKTPPRTNTSTTITNNQ